MKSLVGEPGQEKTRKPPKPFGTALTPLAGLSWLISHSLHGSYLDGLVAPYFANYMASAKSHCTWSHGRKNTHACINQYTYMHIHVHAIIHGCVYLCFNVDISNWIRSCTYAYMCVYVCTCVYIYIYIHAAYTNVCMTTWFSLHALSGAAYTQPEGRCSSEVMQAFRGLGLNRYRHRYFM